MYINIKLIKGNQQLCVSVEEGLRIIDLKHEPQCEKFLEDYECACEGSLACSTCHVVLDQASYDQLPLAEDDENDMLDLAYGLRKTSRLGCQIKLVKELDGMEITIPSEHRNTSPRSD